MPAPDMAAPITSDAAKLRALILSKLTYQLGKAAADASDRDWFVATALAVRDGIVDSFLRQMGVGPSGSRKQIYYFSLEFLIGRLLRENIHNLGLSDTVSVVK